MPTTLRGRAGLSRACIECRRRLGWFIGAGVSGCCGVDLAEVVGGGCEVQFASGRLNFAPGESAQDGFEGPDAGFNGRAAPLVGRDTFRGSESVGHRFWRRRASRGRPGGRRLRRGGSLFPAFIQCNETVWTGRV